MDSKEWFAFRDLRATADALFCAGIVPAFADDTARLRKKYDDTLARLRSAGIEEPTLTEISELVMQLAQTQVNPTGQAHVSAARRLDELAEAL